MKPFLKWVGGKTQILDKLLSEFPIEMNNYHEFCLGGGSVLFGLLQYINENKIQLKGKIYAYDINEELINVYKNIQNNYDELYQCLTTLIEEYKECPVQGEIIRKPRSTEEAFYCKENYYYYIRMLFNDLTKKDCAFGSALFIFLNKTCFRGLYRMGPNGFNVPYGHYKNPEIVNAGHLQMVRTLIKDVEFRCCDFTEAAQQVKKGDFVYIDPPYAPETENSFVKYTADGFDEDKHLALFQMCSRFYEEGKHFLMSNADVELVRQHFPDEKYNTQTILCKRSINAKNPDSKTFELLIKNY